MSRYLTIIFTVVILLIPPLEISAIGITAGLKAGGLLSSVWGESVMHTNRLPYPGGSGGIFADIALGRVFFIQPELLYTAKGCHFRSGIGSTARDLYLRITYLENTLCIALRPGSHERYKPVFYFGPVLAQCLSTTMRRVSNDSTSSSVDLTEDTESPDVLMAVGLGFQVDFKRCRLGFDLRYMTGLTSVRKFALDENETHMPDAYNHALCLFVSYGYKIIY